MRNLPVISILMMLTGMTLIAESKSISSAIADQLFSQSNPSALLSHRGSGRRDSQALPFVEQSALFAHRGSGRCDNNPPIS